MSYVDLHSHVLFGLDDGARTLDDSLQMLRLLGEIGFGVVCATPHQKLGSMFPSREAIDSAYAQVGAALPAPASGQRQTGASTGPRDGSPPSVELRLAAENMWDEAFLERSLSGTIPTYTGERAFLFELPVQILPPRIEEHLFGLRRGGPLPVMAHPERYAPLRADPDRYEAVRRQSALVVDLGALDGAHGRAECKTARWLVEEGLAHAAASDCHQPSDLRAAASGIAWIRKRLGASAVERLLAEAPRRILAGEMPD